jgi:glycosyltransferase involved in cell wall biosynthesis
MYTCSRSNVRLLFVADGRSPIALNWIDYFLQQDAEVHLVSTFPCAVDPRLASFTFIPVAFSELKKPGSPAGGTASRPAQSIWGAPAVRLRTLLRQWLGPLTLNKAAQRLRRVLEQVQPDLLHAMRIPYEGMLASIAIGAGLRPSASHPVPLLLSVWGNDFTLHAPSTPFMRHYTRLALQSASALHADCQRDVRLAQRWGFDAAKPAIVLPGAGGVQPELFYPPAVLVADPVVINPRGIRFYVNNAAFFAAIPLVLMRQPQARFLCPAMAGEPQALRWLDELHIAGRVELLPLQTRPQMAELFRRSRLAASPSTHDGTPNTLLEAMACGCVPVAGDLESLREWITPGQNGLLVDPNDPQSIAQSILLGLEDDVLQQRAYALNAALIAERAEHSQVMRSAQVFYRSLVNKSTFRGIN